MELIPKFDISLLIIYIIKYRDSLKKDFLAKDREVKKSRYTMPTSSYAV